MTISKLNMPAKTLVSLVNHLIGAYPNPDDPEPIGPWGPIVRKALEHYRVVFGPQPEPWHWAALNPQPLPPRMVVAVGLARALVDQVSALEEFSKALPGESQQSVASYSSGKIKRFIDDCGNGILVILVPKHGPFPPSDDEPKPIGPEELIVIGAQLANAAVIHQDFEAAGIALIEMGMSRA